MEDVKAAQKAWADAIKKISKTYLDGGDYVAAAANAAGELYGYGHGKVLFKPTKAKDVQFHHEASQAMSHFVGAKAVKEAGDGGFAINGGKGWRDGQLRHYLLRALTLSVLSVHFVVRSVANWTPWLTKYDEEDFCQDGMFLRGGARGKRIK